MEDPQKPNSILLIDDEPDILGFMQMALTDEGYEVSTATNGLEALDVFAHRQPGLILLDAKMPVMDGWQFLASLREGERTHAHVVLMTAGRISRSEAAELGVDGYLAKPFDLEELLDCVASHLQSFSR